jgi:hypothetical protein
VRGDVREEFLQRLATGQFRRAKRAQARIKKRTQKTHSESGAFDVQRRLGSKLKVPWESHANKDPAKVAASKMALPTKLETLVGPVTRTGQRARLKLFANMPVGRLCEGQPEPPHEKA